MRSGGLTRVGDVLKSADRAGYTWKIGRSVIVAGLLIAAGLVSAQVLYKYKDENGN